MSGPKKTANNYIEGLNILSNMRLCSNVIAQFAVEPALKNRSLGQQLTLPNGRLENQRNITWNALNNIPGISCVKPGGTFYLFPRLDPKFYDIDNDEDLVLDVLSSEKILLVQGSAFNIPDNHHFRIVFLPSVDQLADAITKIGGVLEKYQSR